MRVEANSSPSMHVNGAVARMDYREKELALISEISRVLNLSLGLNVVLNAIAHKICDTLEYTCCSIMLVDPETRELTIQGSCGLSPEYIRFVNHEKRVRIDVGELSEGPSGQAYRRGVPIAIRNVYQDPGFRPWRDALPRLQFSSMIALPLEFQGKPIGVLNCYSPEIHEYTKRDIDLLKTIASQAAVAIGISKLVTSQEKTIEALQKLTAALKEQRDLLERAYESHQELTKIVLENRGLEAIVDALCLQLNHPVLLQGKRGDVWYAQSPSGGGAPPEPLSEGELRNVRQMFDADLSLARLEAGSGARNTRYVAPVIVGSDISAFLVVCVGDEPLSALDQIALERATTVVALELTKQAAVYEAQARIQGDFVGDLVSGRFENEAILTDRASYLGYDLSVPRCVLLISFDNLTSLIEAGAVSYDQVDAIKKTLLATARDVTAKWSKSTICAIRGDEVIVLWPVTSDKGGEGCRNAFQIAQEIKVSAAKRLSSLTLSVGIGRTCRRPGDFPISYKEARECLDVVKGLGGRNQIVQVEDLGVCHLLFQVKDKEDLRRFSTRFLHPILEYDTCYHSQLLPTLERYLELNCSIKRTANALYLHPNTVTHRLKKIEELCQVDLRSTDDLFQARLAIIVHKLMS